MATIQQLCCTPRASQKHWLWRTIYSKPGLPRLCSTSRVFSQTTILPVATSRVQAVGSSAFGSLSNALPVTEGLTLNPQESSSDRGNVGKASKVLLGKSEEELRQIAKDLGQQSYRGKQLHHLIYKAKVKDFEEFSHLPKKFREDLRSAGWRVGRSPIHHAVTAADGTIKVLLRLEDNRLVETVGIPVQEDSGSNRLTACVSSQDVQIGQRMITISTVGVPNTIIKLAKNKLQSTLAVSLHAPNQKLREMIVPSAKVYPLEALMKDCRDYFLETGRRVTFEYTLLAGVNDSTEHASELADMLHCWGRGHHVNLIPFNPIAGSEFRRPYKKMIWLWSMQERLHRTFYMLDLYIEQDRAFLYQYDKPCQE